MQEAINSYLQEVSSKYNSGHAVEHAYRPALQRLIESFDDTEAINDPARSEHGAPDFVFLKQSNPTIIKGYAEAKDVGKNLDKVESNEQMQRYAGYTNLFLTDYLEFRFLKNGGKYQTIKLGELKRKQLVLYPENGERLTREFQDFFSMAPERITNGRRLATIMGAKARRIRDNVREYLTGDVASAGDLLKIYQLMRQMLVHDLSKDKFADMYAQTLVYGLFVARYGDSSPDSFYRAEARDLVPKSNPFLREFFDHIAGTGFDPRLAKIVDELCDIFQVSDVMDIVHKHLRILDTTVSEKDPIIHFYEDFLKAYDPAERKKMGAYYTPTPVVRFIVRSIDRILKEEFGVSGGLASSEMTKYQVDVGQDMRADRRRKLTTIQTLTVPKVQVLDPAVGTATFLNEVMKYVHEGFKGQEGRWPAYARDNLVKRLYGFELMMAPYTIAHLKLGMTLKELGVEDVPTRLNVFLTNTLEEGVPAQPDLFSFGLAEAVSEESRLAAEVKSEKPVMVVLGNPPYSNMSSNMGHQAMVQRYKFIDGVKMRERGALQLEKNLNDDYVKFLAFAQDMIDRNGCGVVGMITNSNYLDGPTMRGVRWNLAKQFDRIYIINLHGSTKKKDTALDGSRDENVFDIQQAVAIILGVKLEDSDSDSLAEVYYASLLGLRKDKFSALESDELDFEPVELRAPNYDFVKRDYSLMNEYESYVSLGDLFPLRSTGVATARDKFTIDFDKEVVKRRAIALAEMEVEEARLELGLGPDTKSWSVANAQNDSKRNAYDEQKYRRIAYRPLDYRWTLYTGNVNGFYTNARFPVMQHFVGHENIGICFNKAIEQKRNFADAFVFSDIIQHHSLSIKEVNSYAPLYVYHEIGGRSENLDQKQVRALTAHLSTRPAGIDILDYAYAALYSPSYREKYAEVLKRDFPRIPPAISDEEFERLRSLGEQLRKLHLLDPGSRSQVNTTFPVAGTDVVDFVSYRDNAVFINDAQYFGNVPESAWLAHVGSYQPAQKWLADRKGRRLSDEELGHYQQIVNVLVETGRIMEEIG